MGSSLSGATQILSPALKEVATTPSTGLMVNICGAGRERRTHQLRRGAEDLVNLADERLVGQVHERVEVGYLVDGGLAHELALAGVHEDAKVCGAWAGRRVGGAERAIPPVGRDRRAPLPTRTHDGVGRTHVHGRATVAKAATATTAAAAARAASTPASAKARHAEWRRNVE
jgi:hypothetical protein